MQLLSGLCGGGHIRSMQHGWHQQQEQQQEQESSCSEQWRRLQGSYQGALVLRRSTWRGGMRMRGGWERLACREGGGAEWDNPSLCVHEASSLARTQWPPMHACRAIKYLYDGDCAMCLTLKGVLERQVSHLCCVTLGCAYRVCCENTFAVMLLPVLHTQ